MYAVIRTGGKQYKVAAGDTLKTRPGVVERPHAQLPRVVPYFRTHAFLDLHDVVKQWQAVPDEWLDHRVRRRFPDHQSGGRSRRCCWNSAFEIQLPLFVVITEQ